MFKQNDEIVGGHCCCCCWIHLPFHCFKGFGCDDFNIEWNNLGPWGIRWWWEWMGCWISNSWYTVPKYLTVCPHKMDAKWKVEKPERWRKNQGAYHLVGAIYNIPPPNDLQGFFCQSLMCCFKLHALPCGAAPQMLPLICRQFVFLYFTLLLKVPQGRTGCSGSFWLWWSLQQRSFEYTLLWYKHKHILHIHYTLNLSPTQNSSHHQHCYIFGLRNAIKYRFNYTLSIAALKERSQNSNVMLLASLCDLSRKVKWPFERLYRWTVTSK